MNTQAGVQVRCPLSPSISRSKDAPFSMRVWLPAVPGTLAADPDVRRATAMFWKRVDNLLDTRDEERRTHPLKDVLGPKLFRRRKKLRPTLFVPADGVVGAENMQLGVTAYARDADTALAMYYAAVAQHWTCYAECLLRACTPTELRTVYHASLRIKQQRAAVTRRTIVPEKMKDTSHERN